ncbi:hypothetical protein LCGC14_2495720, partial [marine sediment metagenome]
YDLETGQFISADPIGFEGGINLYVYVGDNPLTRVDPLGLQATGAPGGFDCDKSLANLLEKYKDERVVKAALQCHVNITCSDDCKGLMGVAYVAEGESYVNVCLDKNKIENEQDLAYIVIHELTHAYGWIINDKSLCQDEDSDSCPPVPDPKENPIKCKDCTGLERAAYAASCSVFHHKNSGAWYKCVKAGVCVSCQHACPALEKKYKEGKCNFPAPTK